VILVDTAVWIDHFRSDNRDLTRLLQDGKVLVHRYVIGELSLGDLRPRELTLSLLQRLPQAEVATDLEVLALVEREHLFGLGIGYIDAHLIASLRLTPNALLWTRDRRLHAVAARLDLNAAL
jgi:predicted nucleic acid-binding protein